jgi:tetratricopeptide (TPR) repeat protein
MNRCLWCLCLTLGSYLIASPLHSQTQDAKAELNLGIVAYQRAAYVEAIQHLERAVSLDPRTTDGHFYLAMTYDEMFVPTAEPGDENGHWSGLAIQEYKKVLELDPSHKDASKYLAHIFFELARYGEAERYYRKAAVLDAKDPEALYGIAVIDWRQTYRVLMEKRVSLNLPREQPLIGLPACDEIRVRNLTRVDDGIELLTKTLQLLDNVDAKRYMAAFYEERAQIQCGDESAHKLDLRAAKQWWTRSCETYHSQKARVISRRWLPGLPPPPPKSGDTCTF